MAKTPDPSAVDQLMQLLTSSLQEGKDFAMEQIPLAIQEYLTFQRFWHTFWVALSCFLIVVFLVLIYRMCRWVRVENGGDWESDSPVYIGPVVLYWIGVIGFTGVAITQTYYTTMVWLAPRVYLLGSLKSFFK